MCFRPSLERLERRLAPTVSVLNNFDGLVGATPPDTCGAAGPSSYIEQINFSVAIYDKTTGKTIVPPDDLHHFLYTTGGLTAVVGGNLDDATMVYDEPIGRFIVGSMDSNNTDGSAMDIAVSRTSNPTALDTANWTFYQIDMSETHESCDYPGNLGYNADAFVFTFKMYPVLGGGNHHTEVAAIDQSDLAAGRALGVTKFDMSGFSYRPVTMHDAAPGGPMWFVKEGAIISDGGPPQMPNVVLQSAIDLVRIDHILTSHDVHLYPDIAVNPYIPVGPPLNPDNSIITTNIDTRILKAAEANNTIVACQNVSTYFVEDDVRWYEINVSNISQPSLVDQGEVTAGNYTYLVYPSIDINAAGDIGMTYIRSGVDSPTDYMSVWVTGRNASDPPGTMETPVLVRAGDSNYHGTREGDFSGINVDADGTFWIANEFSSGGTPATEVAHFTVANVGDAFVKNGALQVTGTNADDNVFLFPNPYNSSQIEVVDNGVHLGIFDTTSFSSINVDLLGGNDSLTLTALGALSGLDFFKAPVTYDGGTGSNSVILDDSTPIYNDTYTITATSVYRPYFCGLTYSNVQNITLDAETGSPTIDVNSTASGSDLSINCGGGNDAINIGNGSLDNIAGAVTVDGGSGTTALVLDDSTANFNDTYTITATTVTRPFFGRLTYSHLAGLTLDTETGDNIIDVNSTASGTGLFVNSNAGNDTINMGSGNLDNIAGPVTVDGGTGKTFLFLNDAIVSYSDTYTITATTVRRPYFGGLTYSRLAGLTLNTETGDNIIDINGTASGTGLFVNSNAGNDTINVGNGNLDSIAGAVTVDGGTGSTILVLDDSTANFNDTYTLTATSVTRPYFGGLTYSHIASLTLDTETGDNTVNVESTSTTVNISNSGGSDSVYVGSNGSVLNGNVQNILGTVNVQGPGSTSLYVDDSGDSIARTTTLDDGQITGLAPATISWTPTRTSRGGVNFLGVYGGSGGNTWTVRNTSNFYAYTFLDSGLGNDTVNVEGTTGGLVVNNAGGLDRVYVGSSGSALNGNVQNVLGTVNVQGSGSTYLYVDDSSDSTAQKATLDNGQLSGLAQATIYWTPTATPTGGVTSLVVYGGGGGNTFTVANTGNLYNFTLLSTGTGDDIVNVEATTGTLYLDNAGGVDHVYVGSNGSPLNGTTQNIHGFVDAYGAGSTYLYVDDSADSTTQKATLYDGQITGLAPANIAWTPTSSPTGGVVSVLVYGGSGGDTFTVANTSKLYNFTLLSTGTGNDTVNVEATTGALYLDNTGGVDHVYVGSNGSALNGTAQNIHGFLYAYGAGSTYLYVDDGADSTAQNATLSNGQITGLTPAAIGWTASSTSTGGATSLVVYGGSGGNTFTVTSALTDATTILNTGTGNDTTYLEGAAANANLVIDGQAGSDAVVIGSKGQDSGSTLGTIAGATVAIENTSGGHTDLTIDDSGDTTGQTAVLHTVGSASNPTPEFTIPSYAPANVAAVQVTFTPTQLSALRIRGGSGKNTYSISDFGAGLPTIINTGNGNDTVTVNITHASGYNLTVHGGEGSNILNLDEVLGDWGGPFNPNPVPQGTGTKVTANYLPPGLVSTFNYTNMQKVTQLPNPANSFVQALFHDVYGRSGSETELNSWAIQLPLLGQAGVASGINHTQEAYTRVVNGWFQQFLGTAPTAQQLTQYTSEMAGGATQEQVLSEILATPQFINLVSPPSTTNPSTAYVDALFSDLLGMPATQVPPATLKQALGVLAKSGHQALAHAFLTSDRYRILQVTADYQRLLHRGPTALELSKWVKSGLDLLGIQIGIEGLPEFFTFGG
jgi:hypothetical protein